MNPAPTCAALTVALTVLACANPPPAVPGRGPADSMPDLVAAVDSVLLPLHRDGAFNGAVVLGRSGEPLYARGFGLANVKAGIAFTPETPSDGASLTKTLTAAAVLMLEEEGRLSLDDPVRRHVAEYPHAGTLIRHLLTHSAGLPEAEYDYFEGIIRPDRVRTTAMFLQILESRGTPVDYEPGTRFRYSSLGFDVAALVVERVSGVPFDQFLRARILGPLGMRGTFVRLARFADWKGIRTMSYRRSGDTLALRDVFDNEGFYGGSNLYFPAIDLYRWGQSFYTASPLSPRLRTRGAEPVTLRDTATGVGGRSHINLLGWYHTGRERRYHYPGMLEGFYSSLYRDEERGYTIALMSNTGMPQWMRPLVMRALIDILDGKPPPAIPRHRYTPLDSVALRSIPGTFRVDGVGAVSISRRGDHAVIRIDGGLDYPAYPLGDGQLYVPGLDVWVGFPAEGGAAFSSLTWLSIFHVAEGVRF